MKPSATLLARFVCRDKPAGDFDTSELAVIIALTIISSAILAIFSPELCYPDADSLLPTLMSIQKLSFYYWGQNRFANLIPLLASPIDGRFFLNLQFQVFLRSLFAMSLPWLILLVLRSWRFLLIKYLFALSLAFFTLTKHGIREFWLGPQPYGTSVFLLACALGLLHLLQANKLGPLLKAIFWTAIFVFLTSSFLVNLSLLIFILPCWLGYSVLQRHPLNWAFLGALVLSFLLAMLHSWQYGNQSYFGYAISLSSIQHALVEIWNHVSLSLLVAEVFAIFISFASIQRSYRNSSSKQIHPLIVRSMLILSAAIGYVIVVASLDWTRMNDFSMRYFVLAVASIPVLCGVLIIDALHYGLQHHRYNASNVAPV
jgi:hypothetical protein